MSSAAYSKARPLAQARMCQSQIHRFPKTLQDAHPVSGEQSEDLLYISMTNLHN